MVLSKERNNDARDLVTPRQEDVLLGRGPACGKHNRATRWWLLVNRKAIIYQQRSGRQAKTRLIRNIIVKVQSVGGRFLENRATTEKEAAKWDEVEMKVAHQKTSQALRDLPSPVDTSPEDTDEPEIISTDERQSIERVILQNDWKNPDQLEELEDCDQREAFGTKTSNPHFALASPAPVVLLPNWQASRKNPPETPLVMPNFHMQLSGDSRNWTPPHSLPAPAAWPLDSQATEKEAPVALPLAPLNDDVGKIYAKVEELNQCYLHIQQEHQIFMEEARTRQKAFMEDISRRENANREALLAMQPAIFNFQRQDADMKTTDGKVYWV